VSRRGPEYLHKLLARIDAEAAQKIAPQDAQKLIRAIEIRLLTRKTLGDVHRSGRESLQGYQVTKIGLSPDRAQLYARIEQRTRTMLAAGWIDEVRRLIANGFPPASKPFQFIGYAQLRDHVAGRVSEKDASRSIAQSTRQFAKRQMTWFRREPGVQWLAGFGDDLEVETAALKIATKRL
jgi:tRNA dimethylallyltransferase